MQLDSLLMVTMNVMKESIVEAYATGGKGRLQLCDAAALLDFYSPRERAPNASFPARVFAPILDCYVALRKFGELKCGRQLADRDGGHVYPPKGLIHLILCKTPAGDAALPDNLLVYRNTNTNDLMLEDFDPKNWQDAFEISKFLWTSTDKRIEARKVCFCPPTCSRRRRRRRRRRRPAACWPSHS